MCRIRFEIAVLGADGPEWWCYDEEVTDDLPLPHVGHYAAPWTTHQPRRRVLSVVSVDTFRGRPGMVTLEPIDCRHGDGDFEGKVEALASAGWIRMSEHWRGRERAAVGVAGRRCGLGRPAPLHP